MAHDALDRWLDQLEADTSDAPTLREISERFLHTRHTLLSACLETIIRQRYAKDLQQTEAVCRVDVASFAAGSMRRRFRRCTADSFCTGRTSTSMSATSASIRWTRNCSSRSGTISSTSRSGRPASGLTCRSAWVPTNSRT
jgi:hypothetical protein